MLVANHERSGNDLLQRCVGIFSWTKFEKLFDCMTRPMATYGGAKMTPKSFADRREESFRLAALRDFTGRDQSPGSVNQNLAL
jgi:hypothetical protein